MSRRVPLKTLAKILTTMACASPHEYGLFWDDDGTMPWKEFYWALLEDPRLRFVRESTLKELTLLGYTLPFVLDGSRLRRIADASPARPYPCVDPPDRLYTGIRPRHLAAVRAEGLRALHRSYVPLWANQGTAERMARRRVARPLVLEIRAREAHEAGGVFYQAGEDFFLARAVDAAHVVFPMIALEETKGKEPEAQPPRRPAPFASKQEVRADFGSFRLEAHHLQGLFSDRGLQGPRTKASSGKKGSKKDGSWKKAARKERRKREV
ncbi:RNA 2'-phosphotransferase family protein [Desulfosoma caldarium]|uniref:Putative RNA 2'-phosphotransferase n=1 Tax=Desulfosoma caldarium TaxID=610254 RepID=A0A3N1URT5_9BACT|nr:hypothetical protein [Desulfosoma caldarium]ROQ89786.1 putative RNA 2'-phosphotransferase [Desulfosoma caldarium]